MKNETLVLTSSALIGFLSQIKELEGIDLSIGDSDGDKLVIKIGEDVYTLESPDDSIVEVEDELVDAIDDINEEGFDELREEGINDIGLEDQEGEVIEGGIIKEMVKTLALGGLIRLTKDALIKA